MCWREGVQLKHKTNNWIATVMCIYITLTSLTHIDTHLSRISLQGLTNHVNYCISHCSLTYCIYFVFTSAFAFKGLMYFLQGSKQYQPIKLLGCLFGGMIQEWVKKEALIPINMDVKTNVKQSSKRLTPQPVMNGCKKNKPRTLLSWAVIKTLIGWVSVDGGLY